MSRLEVARDQIEFARNYTIRLLDQTDAGDWFRQPTGTVSHIGWQVGHLAMAQYRLCLERIRGMRPADADLISDEFLHAFARQSVADPDATKYPPADVIRAVFDRVHRQSLVELTDLAESELDEPVLKPHPLAQTKFAAILWNGQHEMLHAGQIGLLRRALGYEAIW